MKKHFLNVLTKRPVIKARKQQNGICKPVTSRFSGKFWNPHLVTIL